jgi:hypothetical protein
MGPNPEIGALQMLVGLYFVASVLGIGVFTNVIRQRTRHLVGFWVEPGTHERAYDQMMKEQGRVGHARRWQTLLLLNAMVALMTFLLVFVPIGEKQRAQRERQMQEGKSR